MIPTRALRLLTLSSVSLLACNAQAFDPWEGAEPGTPGMPKPAYKAPAAPRAPMRAAPVNAAAPAPALRAAPVAAAQPAPGVIAPPPTPVMAAAPVPVAYAAPVAAIAPVYAPQPVYTSAAEPVVFTPAPSAAPVAEARSPRRNSYTLGIEGFYDNYTEDFVDLDNDAAYISAVGSYTHYFSPEWFTTLSARASWGREEYNSPSGTADDIPQMEFEGRILAGYDFALQNDRHLKPYFGLGTRYYRDESKGEVTNLGAMFYDRRILQYYLPVGVTYTFPAFGLTFAPNIEYGYLLHGDVNTRLQNVPGYYELNNNQDDGYELRAELMMSRLDTNGRGWVFGPFLRYWHVQDSDMQITPMTPAGNAWIEPENERLQVGAAVKYQF